MKKAIMVLSMLLILSVSGCVSNDFFKMFVGGGGGTVTQSPDIIVLENMGVIPAGSVKADTDFTVYFDIRNQGEIGAPALRSVIMTLYNWGACHVTGTFQPGVWSPQPTTKPVSYSHLFDEIVSNQVERIEMPFKAPTLSEIGFMEADCPVDWSVSYNFNARTNDDFTVISTDRLNTLQRAGEAWKSNDQPQYVGIGPVKMYIDFKTPMPVREGNAIQFSVQAEDQGMGTYPSVKQGTFYLKVPSTWTGETNPCGEKLIESGTEGEYKVYRNTNLNITMINRKTPEIICQFKAPTITTPEKSYNVYTNITGYDYVTYGSQSVHVVP